MAATTTRPVLTECRLVIDALAGTTVLWLNGQHYDFDRVGESWWFQRREKPGKPSQTWTANAWHCDCPAFYFHGRCKHQAAVATGILEAVK